MESATRYYGSREGRTVWSAMVVCFGVIAGGSSIAAHSAKVTGSVLLMAVVGWGIGYWALSRSYYFISAGSAGFKDLFRRREVRFEEVRSVTRSVWRGSIKLVFRCDSGTVVMPLDPMDESWFEAVKAEMVKRGVAVSEEAYGFLGKRSD